MKWYQSKIKIAAVLIGTSLVVNIPQVTRYIVNNNVKSYVENNLVNIIEAQEKKMGIKHFGIPKISYEIPSSKRIINGTKTFGLYDQETDKLYIQLDSTITPEKNLTNFLITKISSENLTNFLMTKTSRGKTYNIKELLDHELGHFYLDKLDESLGGGDWPVYSENENENNRKQLISEGIGEYFDKTMNNRQDKFKDSDWPKEIEKFWTDEIIYNGGFHLVKPIIDKYGERGMIYLISNIPSPEDFKDIKKYQDRVLQYLEEETINKEIVLKE